MKKRLTISILLFSFISSQAYALIAYNVKEFTPKGKNYDTKLNYLYYYYTSKTENKITVLYHKTDKGIVYFKGLEVSKNLEDQLPMIVLKYIGKYIANQKLNETKSIDQTKQVVTIAVDRALDQKYKNKLLTEGKQMASDSSYFKGYCNTNWYMPAYYYNYVPSFSKDTIQDLVTNKNTDKYFPFQNYIIKKLKEFNYHHDQKDLAAWGDEVLHGSGKELSNYYFQDDPIKNNTEFHERKDTCYFTLSKVPIVHGKKYPKFAAVAIHGWHATYCNYFASDLRQRVFGNKIWTTNGCSNDFDFLQTNKDFIKVDNLESIINYALKGYFIFLISEDHIATIYPQNLSTQGVYIIQAGKDTGLLNVNDVWKSFTDRLNKKIIAYIYLGYLKP